MQGAGWPTGEELVWDDRGRLLTHSASTYLWARLFRAAPDPDVSAIPRRLGRPKRTRDLLVRVADLVIPDALLHEVEGPVLLEIAAGAKGGLVVAPNGTFSTAPRASEGCRPQPSAVL